ncbi:hypothetical protein Droror1_Dr00001078 [Drosera rotundifolia]
MDEPCSHMSALFFSGRTPTFTLLLCCLLPLQILPIFIPKKANPPTSDSIPLKINLKSSHLSKNFTLSIPKLNLIEPFSPFDPTFNFPGFFHFQAQIAPLGPNS